MTQGLRWGNDRFTIDLRWSDATAPTVRCIRCGDITLTPSPGVPVVEVLTVEHGHTLASSRLVHTAIGTRSRYVSHEVEDDTDGTTLRLTVRDEGSGTEATLHLETVPGAAAFRSRVTVTNGGERRLALRSVASWACHLGAPARVPDDDWRLQHAFTDWLGEGRWATEPLDAVRFPRLREHLTGHDPRGALNAVSTGTWSTGSRLPMGVLSSERTATAIGWQIEANGPWRWELGEDSEDRYLALSGPTEQDHQWLKLLEPEDEFRTVGAVVGMGTDFRQVVAELTAFRRATRRPHPDNPEPAIVFNDYMNTLNGDPSEEKLLPLIDAAAAAGADVFCIDAGWYDDDGDWWDSVGEWTPSQVRFPHGLDAVLGRVRATGMIPGLWLEPEVVGVRSRTAARLPDAAFLLRVGQRVVEHDRYHLDLRHPAARAHLDGVVDRLVSGYGVGYLKFDYNIDPGTGSDHEADSAGDGLLAHARAYLDWVDGVLDRHPALILENCASGAMRADAATLARFQLQSTSDQQDPLAYPPIAAAAPASILPEQAANWAYPQPEMTREESAFTLVTGLSGRFYLSGHLDQMSPEQLSLTAEAVRTAKELRPLWGAATPFWPLGLPGWEDDWIALGYDTPAGRYLAVWSRSGHSDTVQLPLEIRPDEVDVVFPRSLPAWEVRQSTEKGTTLLRNPTGVPSARLFHLDSAAGGA